MKNRDFNGYTLSCKKRMFQLNEVTRLLKLTYWAKDRDPETICRSLRYSYPYGVFDPAGKLVGFLRITSDKATVYYLSDVVVAEEERGKGLGLALVKYALSDTGVCRGKGMLLTATAAGLYAKVGFYGLNDRLMVRDPLTKYAGS
jgi:hypothetical protein